MNTLPAFGSYVVLTSDTRNMDHAFAAGDVFKVLGCFGSCARLSRVGDNAKLYTLPEIVEPCAKPAPRPRAPRAVVAPAPVAPAPAAPAPVVAPAPAPVVAPAPEAGAWNPSTHPYRVTHEERGAHLPHGWHTSVVGVFATEEEARTVLARLFPAGVISGAVDVVTPRGSGWTWRKVASRTRAIRGQQRRAS